MRIQLRSFINDVGRWWRSSYTYGDYKGVPFPRHVNKKWQFHASYHIPLVGGAGKALLSLGNSVKVYKRENFIESVQNRDPFTPLITFCNHFSMIDDPFLVSQLCDWKWFFNGSLMRWSLGAKELLYTNHFTSFVMTHGKVIPTIRGDGIYQPAVTFAIEQLNRGHWLHIFPEAKITLDPIRFKWGIGRIIAECVNEPLLLPFWHVGMEDVLPTRQPYYPRLGKKVTVLFGEPISCHDLLQHCHLNNFSETATRKALTDFVQDALYKLKPETERLHQERIKM